MKKVVIYVDEKEYKEFQLQSLMINKSVSARIRKFIKEQISGGKKEGE